MKFFTNGRDTLSDHFTVSDLSAYKSILSKFYTGFILLNFDIKVGNV